MEAFIDKDMTIDENCWFSIISTNSDIRFVFFNPKQSNELDSFDGFMDSVLDDVCFIKGNYQKVVLKNGIQYSNTSTSLCDDFDEDSKKTFKSINCSVQVIRFFNSYDEKLLPEQIKSINKEVNSLESDAVMQENESISFNKDPYAYYGVSKKDFM